MREIRSILEGMPADSDNGRRIALGAARTALESIVREASPRPVSRRAGGGGEEKPGDVPVAGGHDVHRVGELREAIRGAVDILSGISG